MEVVFGIVLLIVFLAIPLTFLFGTYFFPSIVALKRKKFDKKRIMLLNLFLGWLGPVWIYTCVCAFLDNPAAAALGSSELR